MEAFSVKRPFHYTQHLILKSRQVSVSSSQESSLIAHFQRAEQIREGGPVSAPSFMPPLLRCALRPPFPESSCALLLTALPALSSHRTCFHGESSPSAHLNCLTLPAFCVEFFPTDTISSLRAGRIACRPFSRCSVMESGFPKGKNKREKDLGRERREVRE